MLSKRKSRLITVAGQSFRWAVSPDSGYVVFVAEHAANPGRRINIYVTTDINDNGPSFPDFESLNLKIITPGVAAKYIEQALAVCWMPEIKGPPMLFDAVAKDELVKR
jgi:hypothetical protein